MDFKTVHSIVKNIQDTITNTAIGSARSMMKHTFASRVTNFPKSQKINGIVTVSNQKRVEKQLKDGNLVQKSVLNWLKSLKIPKEIKVSNFPNIEKRREFPKSFRVSNFPTVKTFPKNIRVSNQPTKELKDIYKCVETVNESIKALKLDPKIVVEAPKAEKIIVPAPSVSVTQNEIDYKKLAALIPVAEGIDYKKLSEAIAKEVAGLVVSVGGGGKRKEGVDDITRSYNVSDKDADGGTKYYGFIGRTGNWYILRENAASDKYRYVKGSSDYESNWVNRASLEYDYYHEIF